MKQLPEEGDISVPSFSGRHEGVNPAFRIQPEIEEEGPFVDGLTLLQIEQTACRIAPELREVFRFIRSGGCTNRLMNVGGKACLNWYLVGLEPHTGQLVLDALSRVLGVTVEEQDRFDAMRKTWKEIQRKLEEKSRRNLGW